MPESNPKLIAFIAGVAVTVLGVLLVRPLLESESPAPVPAIGVGDPKDDRDGRKKGARKDGKGERGDLAGGSEEDTPEGPPSFTPGPPPDRGSGPSRKSPPPATSPPPVSDDDDDDAPGDDDDDGGDDD